MYGLDNEELQLMRRIFGQTPHLKQVILYGSRAKGNYKPFSDIDITLPGEELNDDDLTDIMGRLEESSLPYFRDVSLFANISNPALASHIQHVGKTIYSSTHQLSYFTNKTLNT